MRRKVYSKDDILRAMRHSKSISGAARYLGCTITHVVPYFKMFTDSDGKTLYEIHKNRAGKGVIKQWKNRNHFKIPNIELILSGEISAADFSANRIKDQMIQEGYFPEQCNLCGLNERRVLDYKVPLLLNFKDGIRNHYVHENLELLCYNCYFYRVGDVFTNSQIRNTEEGIRENITRNKIADFQLDDEYMDNLNQLGINLE